MNMLEHFIRLLQLATMVPAWAGKVAFIGAFLVLVLVLVLLPARLAGETGRRLPWWRRVRLWAVVIALVQIAIYAWWG